MEQQKVIVTGADGLLGSNLVRGLIEKGYDVSVFLMRGTNAKTLDGLAVTKYFGDILDKDGLNEAFAGKDVVIHAAASTLVYPARLEIINTVNIQGTANVIDAVLANNIKRMIHVGTANSFGKGTIEKPGDENSPYAAFKYGLDYMDSKRKAQELVLNAVKERNLPALIVNPTFMIGPYDSKPSSGAMILALYNKQVPVVTGGSKNYIAVKDASAAIVNAIQLGEIGECYILGNHNYTYKDAFEIIGKEIGVKAPSRMLPNGLVKMYGSVNSMLAKLFKFHPKVTKELALISCEDHCYSGEKARAQLQMPVTPLEVAVQESFQWFKSNGYLK